MDEIQRKMAVAILSAVANGDAEPADLHLHDDTTHSDGFLAAMVLARVAMDAISNDDIKALVIRRQAHASRK